jgi:hypothetical protein
MEQEPTAVVTDLAKAHIAARCLHVVADFGVADAFDTGVASAADIAAHAGLHPDALDRILRLLAAHGVFEQRPNGYAHNEPSRLLRSDHPRSLRLYVRMTGMPGFWDRFTELHHAAASGRPAVGWPGLLERLAAHPEEGSIFNAAMIAKSRRAVQAVADAYDWSAFRTIADVGGGRGHLLAAILERAPEAAGILFELPQVVADTKPAPRMQIVTGDFFADTLPAADAYLLMDLLHDWVDSDAARILEAVRRAAPPHARLLIVETLVSDAPGPHLGKTLDIIMLAVTGGRERTPSQYEALLAASGFRLERIARVDSEYSLLEATTATRPQERR